MKKLMTIAILMTVATTASAAGEYGKANRERTMCDISGQRAMWEYETKVRGYPAAAPSTDKYLAKIHDEAHRYAYNHATDKKDAYMHAFAYCMDNIERAFLDKCGIFSCNNLKE